MLAKIRGDNPQICHHRRGALVDTAGACSSHERTRSSDHFVIRGTVRSLLSQVRKSLEKHTVTYFSAHIRFSSYMRAYFSRMSELTTE
jgi:hypothetical protein